MGLNIGVDLGSISVKLAVAGDKTDGGLLEKVTGLGRGFFLARSAGKKEPFLLSEHRRTEARPARVAGELLGDFFAALAEAAGKPGDVEGAAALVGRITVTGSGAGLLAAPLGAGTVNEFIAAARAARALYPEARTIFEMGGENAKFIALSGDPGGAVGIVDYEANGDCAAGTGSFIDQQAARLCYGLEEVGEIALGAERAARVAGRCSVFAKSDMIHAQQKGYGPPEILRGLCDAVARNFKANLVRGREARPPVLFIGGLAKNRSVVRALREVFGLSEKEFLVPEEHSHFGAVGAALLGAEGEASGRGDETPAPLALSGDAAGRKEEMSVAEPLSMEGVTLLRDRVKPFSFEGRGLPVEVTLGLDIGSVSTNVVLLDEEGNLVKEIYTQTKSRPIEVVTEALREIEEELGEKVRVVGVGTTGSGRELVGELVGADTVNDEITCHKTGALHIAHHLTDEGVDTIFEIGGQDSKFISLKDEIVVDFTMNEACAAGTGSFLEEQAGKLGVEIKGEFARLALASEAPVRLGERCTVFMEKDLNALAGRGAEVGDLVAGLSYSVVQNYLNRVVRGRKIGKVVYFQGGTAYNDAVAAAFAGVLGRTVVVPPHNGVVGAVGAALLAWEKARAVGGKSRFRGFDVSKVDYTIREFTCRSCQNRCEVQEFKVEGVKTYWGDKCSDKYRQAAKTDRRPLLDDLVAARSEALMTGYESYTGDGPAVGIPRAMYFYDRFPLWNRLFAELGWNVIVSDETSKRLGAAGVEATVAEPCYPIQVAHGHVANLLSKNVDYIFLPNILNSETDDLSTESYTCPWGQTLPFVIRSAPAFAAVRDRFLCPTLRFREGEESIKKQLIRFALSLGAPKKKARRAAEEAVLAQRRFRERLSALGREAMTGVTDAKESAVLLVGRPYNLFDRGVNMDLPGKLRKRYGVDVIPMDMLPLHEEDIGDINDNMFWAYGRKILQAAKAAGRNPNLHVIYVTNFKCGPDSFIKHFSEIAAGVPYLTLQFDDHSNDAGVMTRIEAYLDSKGVLRRYGAKGRDAEAKKEELVA